MDRFTLQRLMDEHGETQADIARLLGITRDKVNKVIHGKRQLKATEVDILRRYFGSISGNEETLSSLLLPIIGLVSAGAWQEGFEQVRGHMPSPDKSLSRDSFVVEVEGDSMDLVAPNGAWIIVDPRDLDLLPGRYYIIRNGVGETTFKKYMEGPARLEPCSSNPAHHTIYPGRDTFQVIGRVRKRVDDL